MHAVHGGAAASGMAMLQCSDYVRVTIEMNDRTQKNGTEMTPERLSRIEAEARRMRAEVLAGMIRGFVRRIARAPIVAARNTRAA
jgi:hypothetical protein